MAGLSIICLAILYATTPWMMWVAVAGGIMAAGSGIVGFCPMCAMVGRRLPGRARVRAEPRLVEAACGGDAAAVEQLLVACQPDLRRFARRACSTGEDAEDAVQIALWQFTERSARCARRPPSPPGCSGSWSASATACCASARRRKPGTRRWTMCCPPGSAAAGFAQGPDGGHRRAAGALSQGPWCCATSTSYRARGGRSAQISVDAVKSRLHRARSMMREQLLSSGYLSAEM